MSRAATANFWQPQQWYAATAATAFYSEKSRQGLGLGGLARRGGPDELRWGPGLDKSKHGYLTSNRNLVFSLFNAVVLNTPLIEIVFEIA